MSWPASPVFHSYWAEDRGHRAPSIQLGVVSFACVLSCAVGNWLQDLKPLPQLPSMQRWSLPMPVHPEPSAPLWQEWSELRRACSMLRVYVEGECSHWALMPFSTVHSIGTTLIVVVVIVVVNSNVVSLHKWFVSFY